MAFMDFFRKKKKEESFPGANLEVPVAPQSKDELPMYPASKPLRPIAEEVEREEDYAVRQERLELEEREHLDDTLKKPIFVEVNLYKDMMDEVGLVRNIIKENEDTLTRVSEFKQDEDKEFKKWQGELIDVQRKLIYADKTLFGMK